MQLQIFGVLIFCVCSKFQYQLLFLKQEESREILHGSRVNQQHLEWEQQLCTQLHFCLVWGTSELNNLPPVREQEWPESALLRFEACPGQRSWRWSEACHFFTPSLLPPAPSERSLHQWVAPLTRLPDVTERPEFTAIPQTRVSFRLAPLWLHFLVQWGQGVKIGSYTRATSSEMNVCWWSTQRGTCGSPFCDKGK